MTKSLVVSGSIKAVSPNGDTALAMLKAKVALLCDRSGSMMDDGWAHRSRHELEDEVITNMQKKYPGQIVLVAFHDVAHLCLDGKLPLPQGNTNMLDAFRVAEPLHDAGLKLILITDGQPSHDENEVIREAKKFSGNLDTVYIGPEMSPGQDFLARLTKSVKGNNQVADLAKDPKILESKLERLLLTAG